MLPTTTDTTWYLDELFVNIRGRQQGLWVIMPC